MTPPDAPSPAEASGAPAAWPASWPFRAGGTPAATSTRGMVCTTDHRASRVGVGVLNEGGNAVDAAVAVSFALAVVNPEAGNLGGSGFLLARTPDGATAALDYRGAAPHAASSGMFEGHASGKDGASELGHLAVAVPGSVRGLWDSHTRFGSLPWARLVEPAIELARAFTADHRLLRSYEPHIVAGLARFPSSARIFLPDGRPPREGTPFRQPDLARTLERIRDEGADGFYRGETADLIVEEMRRGGGLVTHADLERYRSVWREAVRFRYRGHTVVSMPPSSSGGATLAAAAHILSALSPSGDWHGPWHGTRNIHLLAEAWRRAYADRNHALADPDHMAVPLDVLTSEAYGRWRAAQIALDAATPSASVDPGVAPFLAESQQGTAAGTAPGSPRSAVPPREGRHTTHVSIVDPFGGAVSLTTTLNTWYGSKVVAEGTGVLLNNEMDDFTALPGVPNHFGLVQGEANRIAPGKRMLSAMTPTLVLDADDALALVVGTPGGSTIITTVFQVVSNVVDHGMALADAVAAPRVHHQHLPDLIEVEPGGLQESVMGELRALGHTVVGRATPWGDVQAVRIRTDGTMEGVADPRRGGTALGL